MATGICQFFFTGKSDLGHWDWNHKQRIGNETGIWMKYRKENGIYTPTHPPPTFRTLGWMMKVPSSIGQVSEIEKTAFGYGILMTQRRLLSGFTLEMVQNCYSEIYSYFPFLDSNSNAKTIHVGII